MYTQYHLCHIYIAVPVLVHRACLFHSEAHPRAEQIVRDSADRRDQFFQTVKASVLTRQASFAIPLLDFEMALHNHSYHW